MVDEQHAVQMVDLMLQAGGQQAVGLLHLIAALVIDMANRDGGGGARLGIIIRDRQATFLIDERVSDDVRISGLMKTRGAFPPLPWPRRSPACAAAHRSARQPGRCRGVVHGFEHVVGQPRTASSTVSTGAEIWRSTGSGRMMSDLMVMALP